VTKEPGRHLGVEEPLRNPPAGSIQYLEVLLGRMGNHGRGGGKQLGERPDVDAQRVDECDRRWLTRPLWPCQLNQGQVGPVGPLSVKLGVQRVAVDVVEPVHQPGQRVAVGDQRRWRQAVELRWSGGFTRARYLASETVGPYCWAAQLRSCDKLRLSSRDTCI